MLKKNKTKTLDLLQHSHINSFMHGTLRSIAMRADEH